MAYKSVNGKLVKVSNETSAKKSNLEIAKEYATLTYNMTAAGGKWLSTNLNVLSPGERHAVVKVYESIWDKVEVTADGGCVCHKAEA